MAEKAQEGAITPEDSEEQLSEECVDLLRALLADAIKLGKGIDKLKKEVGQLGKSVDHMGEEICRIDEQACQPRIPIVTNPEETMQRSDGTIMRRDQPSYLKSPWG